MRRVEDSTLSVIKPFFDEAARVASGASCLRARCGSVIVATTGEIIGNGYNAPPLEDETQRTCEIIHNLEKKPKYDKTCCIHAEWNAVVDACKSAPNKISESTLYFMRVDESGNFTDSGVPYCTTCSRLTMQAGVGYFALWNNDGADIYTLPEYNKLSYDFYRLA